MCRDAVVLEKSSRYHQTTGEDTSETDAHLVENQS